MATVAPWLIPPDFVGAMRAGAQLGLEQRQQDIAQSEAADRLRLAYDQLASEEQQRARETQSRMDLAKASLALRGQQMDATQAYRAGLLENAQKRMQDLADYRDKEMAQKQAINEMARRNIHFGPNGEVLKYDPETNQVKELRPGNKKANVTGEFPVDPNNPFGAKVRGSLEELQQQFPDRFSALTAGTNAPPAAVPDQSAGFSLLHPSTWSSLLGGGSPAAPAAAPSPAAPTTPFNEGQLIRSKADGKLYKVVNGQPVPASDQDTQ